MYLGLRLLVRKNKLLDNLTFADQINNHLTEKTKCAKEFPG